MDRHPLWSQLLLPGLVLLAFMLFLLPETQVSSLRGMALSFASPVLRIGSPRVAVAGPHLVPAAASATANQAAAPERSVQELAETCDKLSAEVVHLQAENAKLRAALPGGASLLPPLESISANVIKTKVLFQEEFYGLDRGESQGVRQHAGVLHRGAVAGRVVNVGPNACSIALLTNKGMSVNARLAEQPVAGTLHGAGDDNGEPACRMIVVARDFTLKPGEHVVTASGDASFPSGLWLGDVVAAKKISDAQWELSVRPACKPNCIEIVQILTGAPPEVPWPERAAKKKGARGTK